MVRQMGEFQQVVALLTSQAETQCLMGEQLQVIRELGAVGTHGRVKTDRGPLKQKMFDGTGNPDEHIRH